jgi:hypothetical protein
MVENKDIKGMPIKYPDFRKRVQKAMSDVGVTVNDIKEKLKITYEMARRYSLGQAMPRTERMTALAKLLHVDPADLQFGVKPTADDNKKKRSNDGWPFSANKSRYDRLPQEEKDRLDGLVEHTIAAWEASQHKKSKRSA